MRAYIARIVATQGLLLGGVKVHDSSPFARREDAEAWASQALAANESAGRSARLDKVLAVMRSRSMVIA